MRIYQVDPSSLRSCFRFQPTRRDITHQVHRLENEGQIEPIQLNSCHDKIANHAWAYSEAQIMAAMELDWPNILVTY